MSMVPAQIRVLRLLFGLHSDVEDGTSAQSRV
jgi:hypothetical protein